jgi:hypothetical protein
VSVPEASATDFDQQPETAGGRAVYEMLLRVHASIRRDLDTVEGLAAQAADGLDANELSEQLDELKRSSFLWRL